MLNFRILFAELIGTWCLVFAGAGAIVVNELHPDSVTHVGIALTFGLIVMAMIYAFGEISGAHINPAVTIAFWFSGSFEGKKVGPYIIVQVLGAILACFVLKFLFPENERLGGTIPSGSWQQSFVMEFILTAILMLVILRVSSGSREVGIMAGAAIGATVGLEAMFAGPVCGASMNPARSIGPALVSLHLEHLWVYIVATIAGACFAVLLDKAFQGATSGSE
jgi:aquaporin Z